MRQAGALVTLAGTGALVAFGSAGAFTGQAGSGGPPTSSAPDLISAKVVRAVAPNDTLGPQVSYCFDSILNQATIQPAQFRVGLYDTDQRIGAASATIDTDPATQGKCVRATFAIGADISQGSVAYNRTAGVTPAVADNAGVGAPEESAPLDGNGIVPALTAVAGATTRPDLVSVSVDPGAAPPQVTYTFDENLDPALPTGAGNPSLQLANHFGFYVDTDPGQCNTAPCEANFGRRGDSVAGVSGKSIVINYAQADNINTGKTFFVDPGIASTNAGGDPGNVNTPRDVIKGLANDCGAGPPNPVCQATTTSPIGAVLKTGDTIPASGAPALVSAVKESNNSSVILTWSQQVGSGLVGAAAPLGNIVAYRADGSPITGTYTIGTNGSAITTLRAVMPNTTQENPTSVVRIGVRPGLANNTDTPASNNSFGNIAIGTEPVANGLSDSVDLLTVSTNDQDNTATFTFDEALHSAPKPSGTEFQVINADGSVRLGQAGSAILTNSNKSVTVKFNGSVSGAAVAGVSNILGTMFDEVDDVPAAGNPNLPGSVSSTIVGCQGGTCVTPTPTVTVTVVNSATPTVTSTPTTPPVTVTPTPVVPTPTPTPTKTVSSKVSGLKKSGKKVTGKVKAAAPCKSGRKVTLKKGSKTLATAKSKGSGKFTLKAKKKIKGKVKVTIKKRTITSGGVKVTCSSKSKTV